MTADSLQDDVVNPPYLVCLGASQHLLWVQLSWPGGSGPHKKGPEAPENPQTLGWGSRPLDVRQAWTSVYCVLKRKDDSFLLLALGAPTSLVGHHKIPVDLTS